MIKSNLPAPGFEDRLVKAIGILDLDQQKVVYEHLKTEGLTHRVRHWIANLIDKQVDRRGGVAVLKSEKEENNRIIESLSGDQNRLASRVTKEEQEEQDDMVQSAQKEQETIYQNYMSDVAVLEKKLLTKEEELKDKNPNSTGIANIYKFLNGPPSNN